MMALLCELTLREILVKQSLCITHGFITCGNSSMTYEMNVRNLTEGCSRCWVPTKAVDRASRVHSQM